MTLENIANGAASVALATGHDMKKSGHAAFMKLCKQDPRYQANHSYRFMAAVLPAAGVPPG